MIRRIIGVTEAFKSDSLPCRLTPVFATNSTELFLVHNLGSGDEYEYLSLRDFSEGDYIYLPEVIEAKDNHCLLQVGDDFLSGKSFEYLLEEKLAARLAELGIEAVKNAKSFLDEGKEDEAEKLLWYAARAMPKSASVLMLLRIVLKGKISEEEMNVLNQKIEELMVV